MNRVIGLIISGLGHILVFASLQFPAFGEPCNPNDPRLLKPDLKALPPVRARVVERQGVRRLYFTTKIANLGQGPLIVEGKTVDTPAGPVTKANQILRRSDGSTCTHDAGTFEFHKSHNHFHVNDFAEYQLRKDDPFTGPIVARAAKVSFCLIDIEPLRAPFPQRQVVANCGVQEGVQGISPGWADVYDDFYPDQFIELDLCRTDGGVPPGQYYLLNVANPSGVLLEESDDLASNAGVISITVPARVGNMSPSVPGLCPTPPTAVPPAPATTPPGVGPTKTPTPVPTFTPTPTVRGPIRKARRPRPTRPPRPPRAPRPPRRPGPHG